MTVAGVKYVETRQLCRYWGLALFLKYIFYNSANGFFQIKQAKAYRNWEIESHHLQLCYIRKMIFV